METNSARGIGKTWGEIGAKPGDGWIDLIQIATGSDPLAKKAGGAQLYLAPKYKWDIPTAPYLIYTEEIKEQKRTSSATSDNWAIITTDD